MTHCTKFYCLNCHSSSISIVPVSSSSFFFFCSSFFIFKISNHYSSIQLTTYVPSNNSILGPYQKKNLLVCDRLFVTHQREKVSTWCPVVYVQKFTLVLNCPSYRKPLVSWVLTQNFSELSYSMLILHATAVLLLHAHQLLMFFI